MDERVSGVLAADIRASPQVRDVAMDRRNFFKIVSAVSAGAATVACEKNKTDVLIPLLVPDHEIVPGDEEWRPSVCTSCSAGCGTIIRVMRGERVIEREGQKFREPIACIKKIEGNPLDPVSGGRLCARGQAALQSLYNPDRLKGPMKRTGDRGKGAFVAISWDEAVASVAESVAKAQGADASKILFLTASHAGARSLSIQKFLERIGAPAAATCSLGSLALERKAAEVVFGWKGLPRYDLTGARYALGVGADFLGGWASPVFYGRQYGNFRQGRPGVRGRLVQAESRMSLTAASADEWLPIRPGSEPQLMVAVARMLIEEKLPRNAGILPQAVRDSVMAADTEAMMRATGIAEKRLRRVVRELGESEAPLVLSGASVTHTNSLDGLIAGHFVNLLLGTVGRNGGVLPPNEQTGGEPRNVAVTEALKNTELLFLDSENPVYSYPAANFGLVQTIVSFGGFLDDSAAYADLLLPDHHAMESELAVSQAVSGTSVSIAVSSPRVRPLYNTRPVEQTLAAIAAKAGVNFTPVTAQSLVAPLLKPDETWEEVVRKGGLWEGGTAASAEVKPVTEKIAWSPAAFAGNADQFPLQFQPYLSQQFHDGRDANLPWMQELPDPVSSAMWDLPVEIDTGTAAKLKVATGDWVRVESDHGNLEAQAYVHPAALPGVVSMGIGQGHRSYGRYASGRGANPLSILAQQRESSTNVLALGGTRVRITRLERKPEELVQFSPNDRAQGPWGHR